MKTMDWMAWMDRTYPRFYFRTETVIPQGVVRTPKTVTLAGHPVIVTDVTVRDIRGSFVGDQDK